MDGGDERRKGRWYVHSSGAHTPHSAALNHTLIVITASAWRYPASSHPGYASILFLSATMQQCKVCLPEGGVRSGSVGLQWRRIGLRHDRLQIASFPVQKLGSKIPSCLQTRYWFAAVTQLAQFCLCSSLDPFRQTTLSHQL